MLSIKLFDKKNAKYEEKDFGDEKKDDGEEGDGGDSD